MSDVKPNMAPVPKTAAELSRSEKIVLIVAAVARTLLGSGLIWLGLSLLPAEPGESSLSAALLIIGAVVIFIVFFSFQLKRIKRARYPQVRSIEALVMVSTAFLAVFAAIYTQLSLSDPESFSEPLNHFTAYYYAMTVLATVGFGDITPVSSTARILSMIQMALDLAYLGIAVKVVSGTAKKALADRRSKQESNDSVSEES